MTTDLTDGSELSEEEFDWDVFAPDPDESETNGDVTALEDQGDLTLDDSDLDWEAALRDPDAAAGADGDLRAGAAYDRIVDTVRRSVEDPDNEAPVVESSVVEAPVITASAFEVVESSASDPLWANGAVGAPDVEDHDVDGDEGGNALAQFDPEVAHAAEGSWLDFDAAAPGEGDGAHAIPPFDAGQERPTDAERGPWVPVAAMTSFEPLADSHAQDPQSLQDPKAWHEPDVGWEPAWEPAPDSQAPAVPTFEPDAAAAVGAPMWTTEAHESEVDAAPLVDPVLQEEAGETGPDQASVPKPKRRERKKRQQQKDSERKPRSRVFTATVVLACLVLVLLAGVMAVRALRHPASTTPAAGTAPHSAAAASPSPDAARLQSATDAVDSATTAAQVGLTSLADLPTTSNVAKVIYPYIASLQLYESVLAGGAVPASARPAAASASAQVRHELTFLDTISNLPPAQLASYVQQFGTETTQLQTTLSALEQELATGS